MRASNKYRVDLRGENYLLSDVNSEHKCGFYTGVWVEAQDPDDAFSKAVNIIRNQKELNSKLLNSEDDTPMIYLEEIFELDPGAKLRKKSGKVFFLDDDEFNGEETKYYIRKKWWEFWR